MKRRKRNTPLEVGKAARDRCRRKEEKRQCIISILLLIDIMRGYN